MRTKFSISIIVLFIFGCSQNSVKTNKVVKIDVTEEYNSNLPELSIKSVASFETNDATLFGDVSTIEYFSNRIYLLDIFSSKAVMVFSKEGKFINKTKLGNGPGEIINPFAFFIERDEKKVLVWDQTLSTMYTYGLDLNFISRQKYTQPAILEFAKLKNKEMLVRSHFDQDNVYTLYSADFKSIKKKYVPDFKYQGAQGLSRSITTYKHNFLISSFNYNVYELVDREIHSEYYFDFDKYKITQKDVERKGIQGIWNLIAAGEKVSAPHEIAESDNFLLFHVYYRNEPIYYIQSFNNDKVYRLNDYFEKGILPKCEIRGFVGNDTFYAMVKPIDMIEFQNDNGHKLVENEIDIQQNPFFITFSL